MRNSEYTANLALQTTPAAKVQPMWKVSGKCGNPAYPLGEQIADTVREHGLRWAASYYKAKGVTQTEFTLLARGAGALQ